MYNSAAMDIANRTSLLKVLILLFSILFLITAMLSVRLMLQDRASGASTPFAGGESGRYHFMVVLPSREGDFFEELISGAETAAREHGVGVEVQTPEPSLEYEEHMERLLKIARISKVDGVALYVTDERRLEPIINRLVLDGIPVVTLESDAPASRRSTFVGTNSFLLGQRAGMLMQEEHPEGVRAVVMRGQFYSEKSSQWSIIHYGIKAGLADNPKNRITATVSSGQGVLGAEEASKQLLFLYPEANVLFCTTPRDTLTAAHMVRQYRREGTVTIIGLGRGEELQRRLNYGDVKAVFVRNSNMIGRRGVGALVDYAEGDYVPTSIYVPDEIKRAELP